MGRREPGPARARTVRALCLASGFVWLATGLAVLHPYYQAVGHDYLSSLHLPDAIMWATCGLEILLGLRVGLGRATTYVTLVQIVLIVGFTGILAVAEPALMVHPLGVLTKNLPLLAVIATAWLVEREGWSGRAVWLLRGGMSIIWITEGLLPKVFWQQDMELDIVARSGLVPGDPAAFLRFMGLLQAASGVAVLVLRGRPRRWLLICQAAAVIVLPGLILVQDPEWLFHPFGPFTKNVPILVGTIILIWR